MRVPSLLPLSLFVCAVTTLGAEVKEPPREDAEGWFLLWADEFEGETIDPEKWTHQVFPGIDSGNRELQHYTDRPVNSFVRDGKLQIVALREDYEGHRYTSARLHTAGKFEFTYGRVEARIKLPSTKGIWPAFWMLPTHNVYGTWPLSGEIDVVESVNDADEIYGTIHYGAPHHTHKGSPYKRSVDGTPHDFSTAFHTYAVEWEPTEMRWYIDGELYSTQNDWATSGAAYPAPFDQEFHLLVNVAVGGNWPGPTDDTSVFPQTMEVDYIRVYQNGNRPPELQLQSPTEAQHFPAGSPVVISGRATDPEGALKTVQVLRGSEVLAETTSADFSFELASVEDGCHTWHLLAVDQQGMKRRQKLFFKTGRGCPREPYGSAPLDPFQRIEAEHFDRGLNGDAYNDQDSSNNGWVLRPGDGVDLSETPGKDIYVGWTLKGEWLGYTLQPLAEPRTVTLRARTSAQQSQGRMRLTLGDAEVTMTLEPTGDWNTFSTAESEPFTLPANATDLRIHIESGNFNLDWIEIHPVN
jgi:beta-glucanase (GH16 family)